jgi:hypothetical protein
LIKTKKPGLCIVSKPSFPFPPRGKGLIYSPSLVGEGWDGGNLNKKEIVEIVLKTDIHIIILKSYSESKLKNKIQWKN